ncbi:MAG: hypothetical protein LUF85_04890 [Bacteroides sp.]|nr:hypothetical protein [Bacteroides sp.]
MNKLFLLPLLALFALTSCSSSDDEKENGKPDPKEVFEIVSGIFDVEITETWKEKGRPLETYDPYDAKVTISHTSSSFTVKIYDEEEYVEFDETFNFKDMNEIQSTNTGYRIEVPEFKYFNREDEEYIDLQFLMIYDSGEIHITITRDWTNGIETRDIKSVK